MHSPAGTGAPRVETDQALVELWLQSGPAGRRPDARASVDRFLTFVGVPLGRVTADDLRAFGESLADLTPAPQARVQSAVVSLLRLGRQVGYLPRVSTGRHPHAR